MGQALADHGFQLFGGFGKGEFQGLDPGKFLDIMAGGEVQTLHDSVEGQAERKSIPLPSFTGRRRRAPLIQAMRRQVESFSSCN
jgi:hypothetical protein